ncbi:MAG: HEPN domain-containing protein [Synergistaceae bacterium]|nr:HEPN domain-containing protein [Synergistaceae bacterium]
MDVRRDIDLSKYRFERAEETLTTADNLCHNDPNASLNRSYYAVFYGMLAVTILDGFSASKHSSVISYFRRNYIKTGIFDAKLSDVISNTFNTRTSADYENFYRASDEDARKQIDNARIFLDTIRPYLQATWKEMEERINELNLQPRQRPSV